MKINPSLALDFYKADHAVQYPPGTELVYSNFTARSAQHANMTPEFDNKVVFFGLQGFIQWFLIDTWNDGFFHKPKDEVVAAYKRRMDTSLGEGAVNVDRIAALHDLGYLPLLIKALPEGSRVNIKVPMFTIVNTLPEFFWLTNYLETVMSTELWKPINVATIAYEFRRQLDKYVALTGSSPEFADWQNHDFSMRGMSGLYDASACGAAHLLSNFGTDTVPAIDYLENYYGADCTKELIGGSVPATEHSVMCMGGKVDEIETFRRLITEVYPAGIVSIVSDTWDFWKVITDYTVVLKDEILNRKVNGLGQAKVVFRPDSGDPVDILCGTAIPVKNLKDFSDLRAGQVGSVVVTPDGVYWEVGQTSNSRIFDPTPEMKGAVECLWDIFGGTMTDKDFRTLHERVGLIYGDSITLERQGQILQRLADKGFGAGNVVFGVGSYTYQYMTRDTFGMAMKATYGVVNGEARELFKDPVTDSGTKKSAKGRLRVEKEGKDFVLYDQQPGYGEIAGELKTVFYNGASVNNQTLAEIRNLLKAG